MKKFFLLIILTSLFSFSACWIHEIPEDYELIDDIYYFDSYDSMVSVIVPMMNKTFTTWHYNKTKFKERYNYHKNNIEKNEEAYEYLQNSEYQYAVKYAISNRTISVVLENSQNYDIVKYYYWITEKDGDSVIFFEK